MHIPVQVPRRRRWQHVFLGGAGGDSASRAPAHRPTERSEVVADQSEQELECPGLESRVEPLPDYGAQSYTGSGPLRDRAASGNSGYVPDAVMEVMGGRPT